VFATEGKKIEYVSCSSCFKNTQARLEIIQKRKDKNNKNINLFN